MMPIDIDAKGRTDDLISRAAARDVINTWGYLEDKDARMKLMHYDINAVSAVDAIPVKWLNQKYAENDPEKNKNFDSFLWDSIAYILTEWKNEQEGKT